MARSPRRFLAAAGEQSAQVFAFYATAVYTGMRAGELAGLLWGDVNFERRLITVQRSFSGPTKAEDVRYVPILDPLLPVLRERRLATPLRQLSSEHFDLPSLRWNVQQASQSARDFPGLAKSLLEMVAPTTFTMVS